MSEVKRINGLGVKDAVAREEIENIKTGATAAGKAINDKDGNDITNTYVKKEEYTPVRCVELSVDPPGATEGTLKLSEAATLSENNGNYILFGDELYYLNAKRIDEKKPENDYAVYTNCVSRDGGALKINCITVAFATRKWVVSEIDLGDGASGKLYYHLLSLHISDGTLHFSPVYIGIYGSSQEELTIPPTEGAYLTAGHTNALNILPYKIDFGEERFYYRKASVSGTNVIFRDDYMDYTTIEINSDQVTIV